MTVAVHAHLESLARVAIDKHAAEAAQVIDDAPTPEIVLLLQALPTGNAVDILKRLTPDTAARAMTGLDEDRARAILTGMDPPRAAALLSRLDAAEREARLATLRPGLAEDLRALLRYPRDTAGGLMDPRVTAFSGDSTVRDVIRRLRALRRRRIQDVFLTDDNGRLAGAVPLQDVVLAQPGTTLRALATEKTPSVQATASREEVMDVLASHRVSSLPVVDFDGRLVGVLRQAELIAATEQAATADMLTMVGASKDERALSSPLTAVRKRLPWLEVNLLTAFLAAAVVGIFEETIARVTALAVLLPVVAGQSGNTGAQALAVTMRALALREVRVRHWLRVSGKELAVGAINGLAVAVTTSVAVLAWSRSLGLAAVIGISMILSMMCAAFSGAIIPMCLTAIRQDPAQSSSIILTTVTDVVGFFSFLGIATLFASTLPG